MSDTTELQAAINATPNGTTLQLDPGRLYTCEQAGSAPYAVLIPPNKQITIDMRGSIIQMAAGTASMSTLMVQGSGCRLLNGRLGAVVQPVHEHRHGLWLEGPGAQVIDVTASDLPGDGFYVYTGANETRFLGSASLNNGRNGLTLGGAVTDVLVSGGTFGGSRAQQIDVEPGNGNLVNDLLVTGTSVVTGFDGDYAVTLGDHGSRHTLHNCHIVGGVYAVWATDLNITGCYIGNPTKKAPITVQYTAERVNITGCEINTGPAKRGIWLSSTGPGSSPNHVSVTNTAVYCPTVGTAAIEINGALCTDVIGCEFEGPGQPAVNRGGVMIRATNLGEDMERVYLQDSIIEGFGGYAVMVGGVTFNGVRSYLNRLQVDGCSLQNQVAGFALDATVRQYVRGVNVGVTNMGTLTGPGAVLQL